MDVVADFYSKPQIGGAMRVMRGYRDSHRNYAVPIIRGKRERVGRAAQGIEDAVKMADGRAIQRFERPTPAKAGEAIKVDFNQPNLGSTKGLIAKALASNDKKKSKKKRKHKRNKIDDVLGDDSY